MFRHTVENEMHVETAEAHRADRCAERRVGGPGLGVRRRAETRVAAAQLGVWVEAAGDRRNDLRLERERRLDETRDTGGGLCMSDVCFDRSDRGAPSR